MAYDVQLVHLDEMLTEFSVGYQNNEFIADQTLPMVRSNRQSDKYYVFNKEAWIPESGDYRAPGTEAHEVPGLTFSRNPYFIQEHALQIGVTDEEKENADVGLTPDIDAVNLVTDRLLLGYEIAVANLLRATASYGSGLNVTLSGTSQWNDYANSDPIANVKTARDAIHAKIFRRPNLMIMGYQVAAQLEDHPIALERIKYTQTGITTLDLWARLFTIDRVLVGQAGYNSANFNQTESLNYVWGKDVILLYVPPVPTPKTPSFGYSVFWPYGMAGGALRPTERWREEVKGRDVVRTRMRYDLLVTANVAGYVIKNAVA